MEKLILFCLILMIVEQALGIAYNFGTRARNEATAIENYNFLCKRFAELEATKLKLEKAMRREHGKKPGAAFLITADGIKALPEHWLKHFESAWTEN